MGIRMGIKKTTKGEIGIENFRGRIRLRWRYQGERFTLSLPYSYLPENLHHGTVKATEIKLDILKGCFDFTLEKYKPVPVVKPEALKPVEIPATIAKTQSPTLLQSWLLNSTNGVITSVMLMLKIQLITCTPVIAPQKSN